MLAVLLFKILAILFFLLHVNWEIQKYAHIILISFYGHLKYKATYEIRNQKSPESWLSFYLYTAMW